MPVARLSAQGVQRLNDVVVSPRNHVHESPPALTSDAIQKEKAAKSGKLPSFIYGVTNLEEEIYFKASGNLDFHDPTSPPLTPDTILWICSMTKLTTAVSI